MNSKNNCPFSSSGFTLIEIIITIVISAVVFTMMFQFFGSSITQSSAPIHRLSHALELKQIAERITEHYYNPAEKEPAEGEAPPIDDLTDLQDNLEKNPGEYGSNYTVEYNGFIEFDENNNAVPIPEDEDHPKDILEVTIMHNNTSEKITMLFIRND